MTIAAGFLVREGIFLCSDTQYQSLYRTQDYKIFPMVFSGVKALFAFAAFDDIYGKMALEECQWRMGDCSERTLRNLTGAIREAVKSIHNEYVRVELQSGRDVSFQFIVALWSELEGLRLLRTSGAAVSPANPFECIGSGEYLAHYLMKPFHSASMSYESAIAMAAHALSEAKMFDSSCGGFSDMILLRGDGALFQPSGEEISHAKETMAAYQAEIRDLRSSFLDFSLDGVSFANRIELFGQAIQSLKKARREPHTSVI
jgi:hypothetical protein